MKTIKTILLILTLFITGAGLLNADTGLGGATVIVTTPPPSAVTGFTATPGACSMAKINLSWNAVSGATNYLIQDNGSAIPVQIPGPTYSTSVGAGSSHTFKIAAQNAGGTSAYINATPSPVVGPVVCPPITYTVTATATAGGTITPTPQTINSGSKATFNVVPNTGYSTSVTGCNGTLAPFTNPGTTYTTGAITANCAVSAIFTANKVNGVCSTTSLTVCTTGTSSGSSGCGQYGCTWNCNGSNGGTNASCSGTIGTCSATHYSCTSGTSANNTNGSTSYTWNCNGSNGGSNTSCSETKPITSGTLSGSNCTIADGQSTCTTALNLTVTNPVSGAQTNITKAGNVQVASGITPASKTGIVVSHPSTTFYLNHNSVTLNPSGLTINANCNPATSSWDTVSGTCKKTLSPINGVCDTTHYACKSGINNNLLSTSGRYTWDCNGVNGGSNAQCLEIVGVCGLSHYSCTWGTSVNNKDNATNYTWNCNGANGSADASSCTENKVIAPTGTLIGSDCTIAKDQNACTTSLTLSVSNPVSGAQTNITKPTNVQVASGITPATKTGILVRYPNTTFYLNHNADTLANKTINAICIGGTNWDVNTSTCKTTVVTCQNGATNPPTCTIDINNKCLNGATNPPACSINGGWSAWNPSSCPSACDTPASTQTRTCTNPSPQNGGANCSGPSTANCPATPACPGSTYLTATDCEIKKDESSCPTTLNWNITPAVGTFGVTTPTPIPPPTTTTIASTASGSTTYPITWGSTNFYLYNSNILKDQTTATASCVLGTDWIRGKCTAVPVPGGWDNGTCVPAICDGTTSSQQCTKLCNNPAPQNGGALCAGGNGLVWNYQFSCGGTPGGPGSGPLNIDFNASQNPIFKGKSSNLTWTSSADNCTVKNTTDGVDIFTGNGDDSTSTGALTKTTTFTLSCSKINGASDSAVKDVKVSSITVIEK